MIRARLVFSGPQHSKTDENDLERSNLHLSIANSLSFNVWRKMNLKGLRIGRA